MTKQSGTAKLYIGGVEHAVVDVDNVLPRRAPKVDVTKARPRNLDLTVDLSVDAGGFVAGLEKMTAVIAERQSALMDSVLRSMLGRWVSGMEPTLMLQGDHVVGLGAVGDPTMTVVVPWTPEDGPQPFL